MKLMFTGVQLPGEREWQGVEVEDPQSIKPGWTYEQGQRAKNAVQGKQR